MSERPPPRPPAAEGGTVPRAPPHLQDTESSTLVAGMLELSALKSPTDAMLGNPPLLAGFSSPNMDGAARRGRGWRRERTEREGRREGGGARRPSPQRHAATASGSRRLRGRGARSNFGGSRGEVAAGSGGRRLRREVVAPP